MHQRWEKLLFLHWPVPVELIRKLVPEQLEIDTFEGQAWIGVTPFRLTGLRPVLLPGFPGLSSFYELNVRTYVHHGGIPGVWFLTLYASKRLPVAGARVLFLLPYKYAAIEMLEMSGWFRYCLLRKGNAAASFRAEWEAGSDGALAAEGSLEFFLIERYSLYNSLGRRLYRCRIHHAPWLIRPARLRSCESTLFSAQGLPEPAAGPMAHFGGDQSVEVWPLEEV
jgi:uncharacterized protein